MFTVVRRSTGKHKLLSNNNDLVDFEAIPPPRSMVSNRSILRSVKRSIEISDSGILKDPALQHPRAEMSKVPLQPDGFPAAALCMKAVLGLLLVSEDGT
jgi:hypothetical protein